MVSEKCSEIKFFFRCNKLQILLWGVDIRHPSKKYKVREKIGEEWKNIATRYFPSLWRSVCVCVCNPTTQSSRTENLYKKRRYAIGKRTMKYKILSFITSFKLIKKFSFSFHLFLLSRKTYYFSWLVHTCFRCLWVSYFDMFSSNTLHFTD